MIKKWISWILISIDKRLKLNLFQNMASKLISENELKKYPQFAPNGVYILSTDGKLYDPNEWAKTKDDVVCIALISDNCRFGISYTNIIATNKSWFYDNTQVLPGVFTDYSFQNSIYNLSKYDFNGSENTRLAIGGLLEHYRPPMPPQNGGTSYVEPEFLNDSAIGFCVSQIFPNGKRGYMGSAGEMLEFYKNKDAILNAMKIAQGVSRIPPFDNNGIYWTSTQISETEACGVDFSSGGILTKINKATINDIYYALPFIKLY